MPIKNNLLIFISVLLLCPVLAAEKLTCRSAVDTALKYNPELQGSRADYSRSYWNTWESTSNMLPTVTLGYTNMWNKEIATEFPNPSFDPENPDDPNNPPVVDLIILPETQGQKTVDVSMPLFTGGALFSARRMAGLSQDISRISHNSDSLDVRLKTITAYYNLVKMNGLLEVTRDTRDLISETTRMIGRMYELGVVDVRDKLRADVSQTTISQAVLAAEQGVRLTEIQLNMVMGRELTHSYELDLTIPEVNLIHGLDDLKAIALRSNPGMRMSSVAEDISQWGVRANYGAFLPSVGVAYHWQEDTEVSAFSEAESWNYILSASFELPTGLGNVARLNQARAQLRQTRYNNLAVKDGVLLGVESGFLQYQILNESLLLAEQQLTSSEQNYQAVEISYESGESTQIELIDARNAYRDAQINLINTRIDRFISYNQLMNLCGLPLTY